ncbi:MAG: serine/threonine-protein kinase [Planctomycetota bacterium]
MPIEPRKDTLAASGGSDFRHGRFEPGQRLGARYRIVARLGEGGMGEVYRADDLELGQSVALKFLPERVAADESWLRRFRNEVRTARQVAHPNVCRIYDIAEEDGHVFLSMEYVDGEDLSGVLRRLGRPSREKSIEIARQICLGLAAAHDNKVLHRDLKPANIMIDGRGRVRITDFGLAGFLDELEGVEARAGTPAYMAPEQLADGTVSVRSDVYSLGLILHELFTGKCVFETNDVAELKRRHTSGSITTPSSITEEIDPAVERVIMRCLEPQPERRPQSVYQVLAALPGGDPLAAALAAGETPSPELVANARDEEALRPAVAFGLLVVLSAALALTYFAPWGTTVMPHRPPSRLSVVAEQIMEELGFGELPRYSVSGYDVNFALERSLRETPRSSAQLRDSTWPPRYRYWRRWSDGKFLLTLPHFPESYWVDGPVNQPGRTATIALDSTGRLLALSVPPALVGSTSLTTGEIDWSPIFERAQLNQDYATPMATETTPSIFCNTVVSWRLDPTTEEQDPVIILMGAVGGRPNYFEYVGLDGDMIPNSQIVLPFNPVDHIWIAINIVMIFLACRNLRAGRADHAKALRCGLLIGGLYAVYEITAMSLGGSSLDSKVMSLGNGRGAGHFLMHAIEAWLYYLAIEPYVRRVWPRMLIGLIRVLSGRLRDPAVGREVLIGLVTGCLLVALLTIVVAVEWRLIADDAAHLVNFTSLRTIMSPGHYLSDRTHVVAWAVIGGLSIAGVVVLTRLLVRHPPTSAVLSVLVIGFLEIGLYFMLAGFSAWGALTYGIGMGVCLVWLYTRVGVLAAMVFFFVMRSIGLFTIEFDAWSTSYNVALLASVLALAAYGFWVSLAGQPIFKDMLAEPPPAGR